MFPQGIANRLLKWADDNPLSPFSPGARTSATMKLGLEQHMSIDNPLLSVTCQRVATAIYRNAVSLDTPAPTTLVMTPCFHILRLLLLLLPSACGDFIAGKYF
jgi:hypothetical protein